MFDFIFGKSPKSLLDDMDYTSMTQSLQPSIQPGPIQSATHQLQVQAQYNQMMQQMHSQAAQFGMGNYGQAVNGWSHVPNKVVDYKAFNHWLLKWVTENREDANLIKIMTPEEFQDVWKEFENE